MTQARQEAGRAGERLAERFLQRRGLKTIARRYSTPTGELDLVMRDGDTIVFVEVKTRSSRDLVDPEDTLRARQRRHLLKAARWFIHRRRCDDQPCRFDVVAVVLPPEGEPQIEHFPDAFTPPAGR